MANARLSIATLLALSSLGCSGAQDEQPVGPARKTQFAPRVDEPRAPAAKTLNTPVLKSQTEPTPPSDLKLIGARLDDYTPKPNQAKGMDLSFQFNFSRLPTDPPELQDKFEYNIALWDVRPSKAWRLRNQEGNRALELYSAGDQRPEDLAPHNLALLKAIDFKDKDDLVLDLKICPTGEKGRLNFCLVANYQGPEHLYFINVQDHDDGKSNGIFRVDDKLNVPVTETKPVRISLDDGWHRVRLVRRWNEGLIEFYLDDMEKPAMTAHDKALRGGYVGFGSFTGTAFFDDTQYGLVTRSPPSPTNVS